VITLPINQVRGNSRAWFWEAFADGDYSLTPCDYSPLEAELVPNQRNNKQRGSGIGVSWTSLAFRTRGDSGLKLGKDEGLL